MLYAILLVIFSACVRDTKGNALRVEKEVSSAVKMQHFIKDISAFCRKNHRDFIIIPQNASELAFTGGNPRNVVDTSYVNAIDAFGIEGLFYNGPYSPDSTRIATLRKLKSLKPVLVSEFIKTDRHAADAVAKTQAEGFIPFIRTNKNYYYEFIPKSVRDENSSVVTRMQDVRNYLYLINASQYKSKQEFLDKIGKTNHDLLIIDLFFNNEPWKVSEIEKLRKKANGGERLVICYMNIGSAETWRYYWRRNWKLGEPEFLGKPYEGYKDEYWVKFWDPEWQKIIFGDNDSYATQILEAGFDGAYLDNVEAYHYIFK